MSVTEQDIRIEPVGDHERSVLREWLDDAHQWGIDVDDLASLERAYEGYFDKVLATDPDDREDATAVCTMIGLALGEHLVRHSALEWRVVTDAEGTDLALSTPAEDAILYPADPVIDAWSGQQRGWLQAWATELIRGVNEVHP